MKDHEVMIGSKIDFWQKIDSVGNYYLRKTTSLKLTIKS